MIKVSSGVASYVNPIPPECTYLDQTPMESLKKYVEQDDDAAINSLLDHQENVALIVKGLKNSPYSLLHQAAAQRKDNALMAMMEKLPIEVWNFRTKEDLTHTPPIIGGRTPIMFAAESNNGELISKLFYAVTSYIYDRQDAFSMYGALPSQASLEELDAVRKEFKCMYGKVESNEIWLKILNAQDYEGDTPLLLAVKKNRYDSFYQLCIFGAQPDIPNCLGDSARSAILALPAKYAIRTRFEEFAAPQSRCTVL
ncbi:hypothetical protein BOTU111921_01625 [Bordetella tumbae]